MNSPSMVRDPIYTVTQMVVSRAVKRARVGLDVAKQVLPVAAAVGDLILSRNQRRKANKVVNKLRQVDAVTTKMEQALSLYNNMPHTVGVNPMITPGMLGPGTAAGYQFANRGPRMLARGNTLGSITIRHRELLGTLSPNSSVWGVESTILTGVVNPGNTVMFPWLSTIAQNYDKYKFLALSFEYVPSCSTTTEGRVIMSIDTDMDDSAPGSYAEHMSMIHAVSTSPWMPVALKHHNLSKTPKFVRSGYAPTTYPAIDFEGRFWLSDNGFTGATGDMFVDYVVVLSEPQSSIPPAVTFPFFTTPSATDPAGFGTAGTVQSYIVAGDGTDSVITFLKVGTYVVNITVRNTAAGMSAPALSGTAGGKYQFFSISSDAKTIMFTLAIKITTPNQNVKLHITGTPTIATTSISPITLGEYNGVVQHMTSF